MKTLILTLVSLLCTNVAMADTTERFLPSVDSLGFLFLLTVGTVCLVIARRRVA